MDESNKPVETTDPNAGAGQGVENNHSPAPESDPEAKINELLKKVEDLTRDRDNYRNATLVLKGKKPAQEEEESDVDLTDPRQMASFVQKQIQDSLKASNATSADEEFKAYAKELARKNKELALALAAKQGMSPASQGAGSSPHSESKSNYFSADQLAEFKRRGYSDEKIKLLEANMRNKGI